MILTKRTFTLLAAAVIGLASISVSAQHKIPSKHNKQHDKLIASQRPAGVDIKTLNLKTYLNDVRERERRQDDEIFNHNWDSQSVNAYTDYEIPQTQDIDVSGYVPPIKGVLTSPYGWRRRFGRMHRGVDLNLNVGDTVVAAFDGKIRLTKYEARGYGYYVVIRHDNGLETVYGHLSRFLVKPNQTVRAGEPIALGGNTGRSTGPHLHFETRFLGLALNPEGLIDFTNYVPHKDVYTFNHDTYKKSQHYGPAKSSKKKHYRAGKKRGSKATASTRRTGAKKSTGTKRASTKRKSTKK